MVAEAEDASVVDKVFYDKDFKGLIIVNIDIRGEAAFS